MGEQEARFVNRADVKRQRVAGGGTFTADVSWSIDCFAGSGGTTLTRSISGAAPSTTTSYLLEGNTCTLNMYDSYGDGWNGATFFIPSLREFFGFEVGDSNDVDGY